MFFKGTPPGGWTGHVIAAKGLVDKLTFLLIAVCITLAGQFMLKWNLLSNHSITYTSYIFFGKMEKMLFFKIRMVTITGVLGDVRFKPHTVRSHHEFF